MQGQKRHSDRFGVFYLLRRQETVVVGRFPWLQPFGECHFGDTDTLKGLPFVNPFLPALP
jgi:hypothetical protein